MNLSPVAIENHETIETWKGSHAFKLLSHHFEVVNNGGFVSGKYEGDKDVLFKNLEGLDMSEDEKLCIEMLKNDNISMTCMLDKLQVWKTPKNDCCCTPKLSSHDEMEEYGLIRRWSKDIMLGQLWELYVGNITH